MCRTVLLLSFFICIALTSLSISLDTIPVLASKIPRDGITDFKNDSVQKNSIVDSTVQSESLVKKTKKEKSPKIAGLLSAFAPGAGQIYNGSYWKPAVIWGGAYYLIKCIKDISKSKSFYHQVLILKDLDSSSAHISGFVDNYEGKANITDATGEYLSSLEQSTLEGFYNEDRSAIQNLYIFSAVLYGFNILDAVVDAHLKSFDVSDDLTLKVKPSVLNFNNSFSGLGAGISIKLAFK